MPKTTQELLAQYTGDAAQLLAGIIELAVSDAFFQGIIERMQLEGRQTLSDDERQQIADRLAADAKAAQDAIDDLP